MNHGWLMQTTHLAFTWKKNSVGSNGRANNISAAIQKYTRELHCYKQVKLHRGLKQ